MSEPSLPEVMQAGTVVPTREGPFRNCVQLPQTRPLAPETLPALYEELQIDLKEAALANRSPRITVRQALLTLGVLAVYLGVAVRLFPANRFFRPPVTVVWSGMGLPLLEARSLEVLTPEVRSALEAGQMTQAGHLLSAGLLEVPAPPGPDHPAWPVLLLALHETRDPRVQEAAAFLLSRQPEMLEARFFLALHLLREVEPLRLQPAWHDSRTRTLVAETRQTLRAALLHLDVVTRSLIPQGDGRTPARQEMLRMSYHHKAEAGFLLWLHDPSRPRTVTPELAEAFRYLALADPGRRRADTVRLRKDMAAALLTHLDWGLLRNRRYSLFGEERDLAGLQQFLAELQADYDRSRSLPP